MPRQRRFLPTAAEEVEDPGMEGAVSGVGIRDVMKWKQQLHHAAKRLEEPSDGSWKVSRVGWSRSLSDARVWGRCSISKEEGNENTL